jgi:hypothetical protein
MCTFEYFDIFVNINYKTKLLHSISKFQYDSHSKLLLGGTTGYKNFGQMHRGDHRVQKFRSDA